MLLKNSGMVVADRSDLIGDSSGVLADLSPYPWCLLCALCVPSVVKSLLVCSAKA